MDLSKPHQSILKKLRQDTDTEDLSADPKKTLTAMDARYGFSTTRVVLTALKKAYPACKAFAEEATKRRPEFRKLDESQEPTEKQIDKFVAWPDVLEFRDLYKDQMTEDEYFALCLYTMWEPVRVDYTPMRVVARKPKTLENGLNYMIIRPKTIDVIFHSYKTHKVYGDIQRRVPKPLERIIRQYRETHPTEFLFQDGDQPWAPQRLGVLVRNLFKRFHGINTGITMLRHSYATHVNRGQLPLKELKKTSRNMMHGVLMNQAYRFLDLE